MSKGGRNVLMLCISVLLLVAIVGGLAIHLEGNRVRAAAGAFLADLKKLTVGGSSSADIAALAAHYERYQIHNSPVCRGSVAHTCYAFLFQNKYLTWLRHVNETTFGTALFIKDGRLSSREVVLNTTLGLKPESVSAWVNEGEFGPDFSDFQVIHHPFDKWQRVDSVHVYLKPEASVLQHQEAYAFDLKCLGTIMGCSDSRSLLPMASY